MTREEAINRLRIWKLKIEPPKGESLGWLETWVYEEDMEALEMAIKSLQADIDYKHKRENQLAMDYNPWDE